VVVTDRKHPASSPLDPCASLRGMERLERFVGSWDLEAIFPEGHPAEGAVGGARATFEWILGGAFLLERSEVDNPDAPDGHSIVAMNADGDGYTQHYFDTRGVARLYDMTFDGTLWTLTREKADFSPLDFKQRYTGRFSDEGDRIDGAWEIRFDGVNWQNDFDLNYRRAG
jgi:hypothetical protein